jgi:hypothetical protein
MYLKNRIFAQNFGKMKFVDVKNSIAFHLQAFIGSTILNNKKTVVNFSRRHL